jgi:ABC-2 type transport system ATP-binding protein
MTAGAPGPQPGTAAGSADGGGPPALRATGLSKRFGEKVAVAAVDLVVPAGSFFGLVGPNGAGKTTTMLMATGLLRPDLGIVEVLGADVWRDPVAAKRVIGVLPEGLRLFERLSGRELLQYVGRLHRLAPAAADERAEELLDVFGLSESARTLVVDYSTGMRKKVALAAALIANPRVLFLDEPFEAVDPVSAHTIREVLLRYTASGSSVIFSSHAMDLVERLCDRVAIMHGGRIVAAGALEEVRGGRSLEEAFLAYVGAPARGEGLTWLGSSSD